MAEPLLREALSIAEVECGENTLRLCGALNALGLLFKDLAKYDEARACYERALDLVDTDQGSSIEIAALYHNLGGIEHARQNYVDGEIFARKGIEIRKSIAGLNDQALAADMVALAAILDGQQKFDEAEPLYLDALQTLERSPETNAAEIAVALNDLGALYAQRGLADRAEELLTRAADIKVRTIGSHHPDVAVTLNNLAIVHKRQGDLARASALYERALDIFEKTLGPDHPKTTACRRNYHHCSRSGLGPDEQTRAKADEAAIDSRSANSDSRFNHDQLAL